MFSAKKLFIEILQNSQENTCARVSFLINFQAEACNFKKKQTLAQVFFCEFCKIYKNTFCYRTPPVATSVHKIKVIQKRALRFMLHNYESYYEDLLKRSEKPGMNLRRTITLCTEIYKIINNLNPEFLKNLFKL